jgi:hypothetical protein
VGGHSAAAYPSPFFTASVDAICADDGEVVVPALADALERRHRPSEVPGLLLRGRAPSRSTRCRPRSGATSTRGVVSTRACCFGPYG